MGMHTSVCQLHVISVRGKKDKTNTDTLKLNKKDNLKEKIHIRNIPLCHRGMSILIFIEHTALSIVYCLSLFLSNKLH